jgi:SAM-dependent methyltransferase
MDMQERYDMRLIAAYVRAMARNGGLSVPAGLLDGPLDMLTEADCEALMEIGQAAELKLYRFKNHEELPRVKKVIGFLKAVQPESLLDVGSGRGVFLFPFLKEFPWVPVTSLDLLPHRVEMLDTLRMGGVDTLTAQQADICSWNAPDGSFDVVTLLEVLEHIPQVEAAVQNALRLAKRFVVVTVPSKPDDNPEHIHLLTKDKLTKIFADAGCRKLRFDGVYGHLVMIASKE